MSGICGIISSAPLADGDIRTKWMLDAMAHRGTDSRGTASPQVNETESIFLGCLHQADIDTQPNAQQPLIDPDSGNILLFNGEIYNFKELQAELTKHGIAFVSGSDAEVLLMAYTFWGTACLNKIRGVFAFAIWDAKEQKLFMARDAMGVMPLYFGKFDAHFIFATEVRATLASQLVPREIDIAALESMLAYGAPQEPLTLVQGIHSLPAGCYVEIKNNEISSPVFFPPEDFNPYTFPEDDIADLLRQSLIAAAKMQSFADVQSCMLFDGSLSTTALAALFKTAGIIHKAYAVALEDTSTTDITEVAKKLDIDLEILTLDDATIRNHFVKALDSYDQPSIQGIDTWIISHLVTQLGNKVAISGIGCNSLFPDEKDFASALQSIRSAAILRHFPNIVLDIAEFIWHSDNALRTLDNGKATTCPPYLFSRQIIDSDLRAHILGIYPRIQPKWLNTMAESIQSHSRAFQRDIVNHISFMELSTYIRSMKLRNADQLGMANGLEIRAPYMDSILVNMMLKIPGKLKLNRKQPKSLLFKSTGLTPEFAQLTYRLPQIKLWKYMTELCSQDIDELFHAPPMGCMRSIGLVPLWKSYKAGKESWRKIWCIFNALRWIHNNIYP